MTQTLHRQVVLAAHPDGVPKPGDFRIEEGAIAEPGDNEMLIRTLYIGIEPNVRLAMKTGEIGAMIPGAALGVVVKSNNPKFKTGDVVEGFLGWQNYLVTDGEPDSETKGNGISICDPELADPIEFLGPLGVPGLTAILALKHEGKLDQEESIVITNAEGMVGCMAGQLALLLDGWVVGVTDSDDRCSYLTDELGFDAAINHASTKDLDAALKDACPDGIDYFFDNSGGPLAKAIEKHLSENGRVTRAGASGTDQVEGLFSIAKHTGEYEDARNTIGDLLRDEGIQYERTIVEGLDNAPQTLIDVLTGKAAGQCIVQVS